jgi:tRNA pseudouridine55 synthase
LSHDLETVPTDPVDISHIKKEDILSATKSFIGEIGQIPPQHSAIKIGGKRAYQFARKGKEAILTPRSVHIREFEITSIALPSVSFKIICSKGTYIRSIARDFGNEIGVGAFLSQLCRTRIGEYKLEDALQVEDIQA